jgi:hypothetical protein
MYSRASVGENGCMNGPARTSRYRRDSSWPLMNALPPQTSIAFETIWIAL